MPTQWTKAGKLKYAPECEIFMSLLHLGHGICRLYCLPRSDTLKNDAYGSYMTGILTNNQQELRIDYNNNQFFHLTLSTIFLFIDLL